MPRARCPPLVCATKPWTPPVESNLNHLPTVQIHKSEHLLHMMGIQNCAYANGCTDGNMGELLSLLCAP